MTVDDIYIASGKIVAVPLAGEEIKLITFLAYRNSFALPSMEERALVLLRQMYKQLKIKQRKMARSLSETICADKDRTSMIELSDQ